MPQTFETLYVLKMVLTVFGLLLAVYLYMGFVWGMMDLYPDMIWDEVIASLLGVCLAIAWLRFRPRR